MYAAVGDQLVERQARYLAAHRVETADNDSVRRVVDDNLHAGEALKGADIAALAADDAALHLLVLEVEDRHRVLDGRLRGSTLYALYHHLLGLLGGGDLGLLHDVHDSRRSLGTGFLGHCVYQVLLGLVGGHAGYVLQLVHTLFVHLLHLGLALVEGLNLAVQLLAHTLQFVALLLQFVDLLVEVLLALFQFVLGVAHLVVLLVDALVVLALELQELLLGLQFFLFLDDFTLLLSVLQHLLAAGHKLVAQHTGGEPHRDTRAGHQSDYNP